MQKIIIFGTGKFFKNVESEVKQRYEIAAFLDNKVPVGEKVYYENDSIPIHNPEDISKIEEYPIIIMSRQFIDISIQLMQLNVWEERILFGVSLFPQNVRERIVFTDGECIKIEDNKLILYTTDKVKHHIRNYGEYEEILIKRAREKERFHNPYINLISNMPVIPASREFGGERGKPIDRFYIEKFLEENKKYISGDTLEIAETTYSLKYGEDRIKNAYMLHVEGWGENAIKGNLETGDGIEENKFDSVIITQTLMFLYDIENVAGNIYKMLKKGGYALITVSGISQISRYDADNWGSYYSFHEDAIKRMFVPLFGEENVKVTVYGNVKTAISLLYGLCCEDLQESDFNVEDKDYPVIIGAVLQKNS